MEGAALVGYEPNLPADGDPGPLALTIADHIRWCRACHREGDPRVLCVECGYTSHEECCVYGQDKHGRTVALCAPCYD